MSSVIYGSFGNGLTRGTSVATTSGTAIDFTGIPNWVKRITIMLNGVSTSGTSNPLIQLGAGSIDAASYNCIGQRDAMSSSAETSYTTGFGINGTVATYTYYGLITLTNQGSNTWIASGTLASVNSAICFKTNGSKILAGALDRVRLTTVGGTDTFDAGSINILYE